MEIIGYIVGFICGILVAITIYDLTQKSHTILRIFPIIGHFRYLLEKIGPELRQYIVTDNDEERPFSRDERRWIYASAKGQNNLFSFGTDNDLDRTPNHIIIKHSAFVAPPPSEDHPGGGVQSPLPCAKVIGDTHRRTHAFRPASLVNISGMSYGALGKNAVTAMNMGASDAGVLHTTGEGGLSDYHLCGADLVFQFGTGYFGARDKAGGFSLEVLKESIADHPVRAIEIKLSQGAKPGHGAILPGEKVTAELARIRNVEVGVTCESPPHHRAFSSIDQLIDFVELIADETGLPVGIKSAVGTSSFWEQLARRMRERSEGPDFITIDGGEGGTGAAPLSFTDHVSLPFQLAMPIAYRAFAEQNIAEDIVFIGSGRLGLPDRALVAFALGCDTINVAREAMLAIGCIQAQRCHTNHCPTGVTTHSKWRQRGLVPTDKAPRLASYLRQLRRELAELSRVCGVSHPAEITAEHLAVLSGWETAPTAHEIFGYDETWGRPKNEDLDWVRAAMQRNTPIYSGAVWPV